MNLPNKLTVSRFVLTVAFLGAMYWQVKFHETLALALFIAGGVSDLMDGIIARRHQLITNFGILMDPLAFTELAKWVAVALTALSGCLYLWRNRATYLQDL